MIEENDLNGFNKWDGFNLFKENFRIFMENFGHRSDNEFELGQGEWAQDAEQLKEALLREKRIMKVVTKDTNPQNLKIVNSFKLREELKNLLIFEYRKIRRHFLLLAESHVKDKKLNSTGDIFFLKWDEIQEIEENQKKFIPEIKNRKMQFSEQKDTSIPFSFSTDDEGKIIQDQQKTENTLRGVGCSRGIIKGRAVHIFSLQERNKLKNGDIMITFATDPGWTPLFAKVAGVITEIGGMLSHTATIAREFNIPMITGIQNLERIIPDGKTIEMDGTNGIIKIMEDE